MGPANKYTVKGFRLFCQETTTFTLQVLHVCRFAGQIQRALSPDGLYFRFRCVAVSLFVCPCLSVIATSLYLYLSVRPCLLVHLSLPVSVYLSLAVSLSLSVHLSLFVRLFLSVSLSVRPFLLVYLCPSVCFGASDDISPSFSVLLSLSHSVHLSLSFSVHLSLSIRLSLTVLSAHMSVCRLTVSHMSLFLSVHLSLSVCPSRYICPCLFRRIPSCLSVPLGTSVLACLTRCVCPCLSVSVCLSLSLPSPV